MPISGTSDVVRGGSKIEHIPACKYVPQTIAAKAVKIQAHDAIATEPQRHGSRPLPGGLLKMSSSHCCAPDLSKVQLTPKETVPIVKLNPDEFIDVDSFEMPLLHSQSTVFIKSTKSMFDLADKPSFFLLNVRKAFQQVHTHTNEKNIAKLKSALDDWQKLNPEEFSKRGKQVENLRGDISKITNHLRKERDKAAAAGILHLTIPCNIADEFSDRITFDGIGRVRGLRSENGLPADEVQRLIENQSTPLTHQNSVNKRETPYTEVEGLVVFMGHLRSNDSPNVQDLAEQAKKLFLSNNIDAKSCAELYELAIERLSNQPQLLECAVRLSADAQRKKEFSQYADNIFGRTFDSELANALIQNPTSSALDASRKIGVFLVEEFDDYIDSSELQSDKREKNIEQRMKSFAEEIRKEHRPWFSRVPELTNFLTQPTYEHFKTMMCTVDNGFDTIKIPFLATKMVKSEMGLRYRQWKIDGDKFYCDEIRKARSVKACAAGTVEQELMKAHAEVIRQKTRGYGILLPYQRGFAQQRYSDFHDGKDICASKILAPGKETQFEKNALDNGHSVVCGASGCTNLMFNICKRMEEKQIIFSHQQAYLSTLSFLMFDGGHSFHESFAVYQALLAQKDQQSQVLQNYVGSYLDLIDLINEEEEREAVNQALECALDRTVNLSIQLKNSARNNYSDNEDDEDTNASVAGAIVTRCKPKDPTRRGPPPPPGSGGSGDAPPPVPLLRPTPKTMAAFQAKQTLQQGSGGEGKSSNDGASTHAFNGRLDTVPEREIEHKYDDELTQAKKSEMDLYEAYKRVCNNSSNTLNEQVKRLLIPHCANARINRIKHERELKIITGEEARVKLEQLANAMIDSEIISVMVGEDLSVTLGELVDAGITPNEAENILQASARARVDYVDCLANCVKEGYLAPKEALTALTKPTVECGKSWLVCAADKLHLSYEPEFCLATADLLKGIKERMIENGCSEVKATSDMRNVLSQHHAYENLRNKSGIADFIPNGQSKPCLDFYSAIAAVEHTNDLDLLVYRLVGDDLYLREDEMMPVSSTRKGKINDLRDRVTGYAHTDEVREYLNKVTESRDRAKSGAINTPYNEHEHVLRFVENIEPSVCAAVRLSKIKSVKEEMMNENVYSFRSSVKSELQSKNIPRSVTVKIDGMALKLLQDPKLLALIEERAIAQCDGDGSHSPMPESTITRLQINNKAIVSDFVKKTVSEAVPIVRMEEERAAGINRYIAAAGAIMEDSEHVAISNRKKLIRPDTSAPEYGRESSGNGVGVSATERPLPQLEKSINNNGRNDRIRIVATQQHTHPRVGGSIRLRRTNSVDSGLGVSASSSRRSSVVSKRSRRDSGFGSRGGSFSDD